MMRSAAIFLESHGNHHACVVNYTWRSMIVNIPVNGTYIWLKVVYKISLQAYG